GALAGGEGGASSTNHPPCQPPPGPGVRLRRAEPDRLGEVTLCQRPGIEEEVSPAALQPQFRVGPSLKGAAKVVDCVSEQPQAQPGQPPATADVNARGAAAGQGIVERPNRRPVAAQPDKGLTQQDRRGVAGACGGLELCGCFLVVAPRKQDATALPLEVCLHFGRRVEAEALLPGPLRLCQAILPVVDPGEV